ncbi:MAG: endonuclease/exonuclease/phosphatase family protein [Catalinimonas sp.]
MKHLLSPLLFLALHSVTFAQTVGMAPPRDYTNPVGDTLTVLSWNVEHFVDPYDDPYIRNRREDAPYDKVYARPQLLTRALLKADADVVVLQEFESGAYAAKLADSLFPELGYRFFAAAESPDWYMNVVVMSRVPLGVIYSYKAVTTPVLDSAATAPRETQNVINTRMMAVDVLVNPDYRFTLTGLHLKAGRKSRDVGMRVGQIEFLKGQWARFADEDRRANLLVAGDLNALPNSPEFDALLAKYGRRQQLVDPLAGQAVYSHPSDDPQRRLDHLLPNRNMARELVSGSVGPQLLLSTEEMRELSDHLPMQAKFLTKNQ